jgi:hypothetical protein
MRAALGLALLLAIGAAAAVTIDEARRRLFAAFVANALSSLS